MNTDIFIDVYQSFQWVFSLGYVTVLSVIATIFLVKAERVTILKKSLASATDTQKDSILGFAGTITSLTVFILFHFANEMILQGKFLIDFDAVTQGISIPSGAAIVWSSSKGIYTVFHKWWQRVKAGENIDWKQFTADLKTETQKANTSSQSVATKSAVNGILNKLKSIFSKKATTTKTRIVINKRTGEDE